MNSSGIKRGLAGSAVAALAVTGLPFLASSASAEPISDSFPNATVGTIEASDFELLNPDSNGAPVTTQPYNLVAAGNADVPQVLFQFSPTGAAPWTNIGGVVDRVNGAFVQSWTPTGSGTVRVVPIDSTGTALDGSGGTPDLTESRTVAAALPATVDTAKIGGDTNVGVWNDAGSLVMGVSGTTSLTDTASALDDNFRVAIEARTGSNGTGFADVEGAANGTFDGVLPLPGYTFPAGGPDQIVIGAQPQDAAVDTADTDGDGNTTEILDGARPGVEDAAVKTLYLQQLATVTAEAENTNLQPGQSTDVTVSAVDQNGSPIAGATVYRTAPNGTVTNVGTTGADGQLESSVTATGAANDSFTFHVNAAGATTNLNTVETVAGDRSASVAIANYVPALTSVNVTNFFGPNSDLNEVDSGTPFTATALDQNGNPVADEQLHYTWTVTPFGGGAAVTSNEIAAASLTDDGSVTPANKGQVQLRMATVGDFTPALASLPSGTWTLKVYRKPVGGNGAFNAAPVDFKFGQAAIAWSPEDAQAPMGGSVTLAGSLSLEDGTAIGSIDRPGTASDVNRTATLAYTPGTEQDDPSTPAVEGGAGDSRIAPKLQQDATVTSVNAAGTAGAVQVDANGVANVKINDASPETLEELDAVLDSTPDAGLGGDPAGPPVRGNVEVDFLRSVDADAITGVAPAADIENVDGEATTNPTPGRPQVVTFTVTNNSGQTLSGKEVTVTVNNGAFITDDAGSTYTPAQRNGVWANDGQTATVTTDGNGQATVTVAIERAEGFDDDFSHTVNVKADVDGKSVTQDVVFKSWDAVDLDTVEVVPTEGNTANLPDAQVGFEEVDYNVYATDSFGNLSREAFTATDSDNGLADITFPGDTNTGNSSTPSDFTASADGETTQEITVSVLDRNGGAADAQATESVEPINWYEVDFSASTFSLAQQGAESVPAGTRVTQVATAVDQKGHPITGLAAKFLRSGPEDGDSDGNGFDITDANGNAFYDFTGGGAGTARISVVFYTNYNAGTGTGTRVGTAEDTVTFTGNITPEKAGIRLKASGNNNGGKADKLKVKAKNNAAGLVAKVFVKGQRVASHKLNGSGDWTFTIKDKNGNKGTKYTVRVAGTESTKAGKASATIR